MPAHGQRIRLHDGRWLGYAEYGDTHGRSLFYFHGLPGSRLDISGPAPSAIAEKLGIRVVALDRPGFGLSDFQPERTLGDWPKDVVEAADALSLNTFAVLGLSGGGPYAAACARYISERLTAAAIVGGILPLDTPEAMDALSEENRQEFGMALKAPTKLRQVMARFGRRVRRQPEKVLDRIASELTGAEQAALALPEVREYFLKSVPEAFRRGSRGYVWEDVLLARSWGFRLEDIGMPVYLWHGELDAMVLPAMGRSLASAIPNCKATFYPTEGHLSLLFNRFEEILRVMMC